MIRKGMFISDRYEIIDKIGSGGMSDVYKAKCHKLNRFVAIKVLKQEYSEDTNFVSKFIVEAQSAAGLTHPNIVGVYDVAEDNGIYYIVMELIEGITLKKYIEKKGKIPVKEAVSIAIQVAQGIEAAHNNHIIHRDIKPQNIMISREGKVKVTDFGIARAASNHTINGNAMGSVHYISPEQAKGGYIDEKSDIYSLGITLFEMITGMVPFTGDSTVNVALQHINEEMPNPREFTKDVPISVEKIIAKCTQKIANNRYLTIADLIVDLKRSLIMPDEDFVIMAATSTPFRRSGMDMNSDETDNPDKMMQTAEIFDADDEEELPVNKGDSEEDDEEYDDEYDEEDDEEYDEDDDIDEVNPKLDKAVTIGTICGGVLFLVVIIAIIINAVGGCDSKTDDSKQTQATAEASTLSDKQTKVPYVVGMSEEDAIKLLQDSNLGYKIESREHNNTYEKGEVVSQSEEEDAIVDKNSTIKLVISDGPEMVDIPDVKLKTKDEAKSILEGEGYGFKVKTEYEVNDYVDAESVIRIDPEAGTTVEYGSEVTLYISQGADTSNVDVPNLKNQSEKKAKEMLEEIGLSLAVADSQYDDSVEEGNVINQQIEAGKSVPRGTEIAVTLSLGAKPTETTTEEPTTKKKKDETTTEEETTEEQTTTPESTSRTVRFASINYGATIFGDASTKPSILDKTGQPVVDEEIKGTVRAVLEYKNNDGDSSTSNVTLTSSKFNYEWFQEQLTFEKDTAQNSEATLKLYLSYSTYEDDGTGNYVKSDKTDVLIYKSTSVFD